MPIRREDNRQPDRLTDPFGKSFYNIPFQTASFQGMPYRSLGHSGLKVPLVGLGTWKFGYPELGDGARVGEKNAFLLFDKAMELGVTFWDTANRYNNASGNSERLIGRWLQKNPDQRRNVILATKVGGLMDGITPNHGGLSRLNVMESVYASLERLQVDHIDLLYFHMFDPAVPIEESLMAIEDLVKEDVVRYFAVSNFTVAQLDAYQKIQASLCVRSRMVAVQNQYDLLHGEVAPYQGVLEDAHQQKMAFIAWSPLARGLLTGRYTSTQKVGAGDRLFDENALPDGSKLDLQGKIQSMTALALQYGLPLSQLVIAYMLHLPAMGPVIASVSDPQQLASNAAAGKYVLEEDLKMKMEAIVNGKK